MADIELVIKIPEEIYHNIKNGNSRAYSVRNIAIYAIENGTPLPKEHGRLIDVSELLTTTDIREDGSEFTYISYSEIDNAPTIIQGRK